MFNLFKKKKTDEAFVVVYQACFEGDDPYNDYFMKEIVGVCDSLDKAIHMLKHVKNAEIMWLKKENNWSNDIMEERHEKTMYVFHTKSETGGKDIQRVIGIKKWKMNELDRIQVKEGGS